MGLLGRRRSLSFELAGLVASADGLYDGSFVIACAQWWNHEVVAQAKLRSAGHRPFTTEEVRRLCGVVQPLNRPVFEAVASAISLPGRQSSAVLSLAYALALIVDAGAGQTRNEAEAAPAWTQARPLTANDLTELERHYSEDGHAREYEEWAPYWMAVPTVFDERIGPKLIASARASFDNQVDRWGAAEGTDLRQSIGSPDWSLIAFEQTTGLTNFVELLFEWGGRLRLGERLLADGVDLADYRFGDDDGSYGFIDSLYSEAFERYAELASGSKPPISDDIETAVRMCALWLGDKLEARQRLGISTTAVRAYLWRTVEGDR